MVPRRKLPLSIDQQGLKHVKRVKNDNRHSRYSLIMIPEKTTLGYQLVKS
jgi:hypothetical protein